jgi:hypothetical protein
MPRSTLEKVAKAELWKMLGRDDDASFLRHCERTIQEATKQVWIASSLALLAMTAAGKSDAKIMWGSS